MSDKEIKVTATFSLSKKPAFHGQYPETATVGTVLAAVRDYFEAKDEPNVSWYLSARDERQAENATLRTIAGQAEAIAFRLIKDLTQG